MDHKYSAEKNVQILIDLLKSHGIKKVIASPGATNLSFVASLQYDGSFEMYSAVDERGAAYMAVGLAFESGEPVVITCTGATASRNYFPGLTEAFHRKLPILAVTATQDTSNYGNLVPQCIDRSEQPEETVRLSVNLPYIHDNIDEWRANLDVNRALLELKKDGGGPVHINLTTRYDNDFSVAELPKQRVIRRITPADEFPDLPDGRIAVSVGIHEIWDDTMTEAVEQFCESCDAVVFTDHSSGYHGKYGINPSILASQEQYDSDIFNVELLIHIGGESGDYYTYGKLPRAKEVWRISEDGELRDTFRKLTRVFEMRELDFFSHYIGHKNVHAGEFYSTCREEVEKVFSAVPELPFSNVWLAKTIAPKVPEHTTVHLGVSNTMRAWTFFDFPETVLSIANVGCRGIDGSLSTVLGMSLADPCRIHFCVLGDLTFFYDMNALGNRQVGRNIRILLVNNGIGTEFKNYQHRAQQALGDDADLFVAAAGHNGNKSELLVHHYAEDLGFQYLTASNKEEVEAALATFLNPELTEKPMLFEVFTDSADENKALELVRFCKKDATTVGKQTAKNMVKNILGDTGTKMVKKAIGKDKK